MTPEELDKLCAEAEALIEKGHKVGLALIETDEEISAELSSLGDIARDILPALLAERKVWREGFPMETAPRDGTEILTYSGLGYAFWAQRWSESLNRFVCPGTTTTKIAKRWWPLPGSGGESQ